MVLVAVGQKDPVKGCDAVFLQHGKEMRESLLQPRVHKIRLSAGQKQKTVRLAAVEGRKARPLLCRAPENRAAGEKHHKRQRERHQP